MFRLNVILGKFKFTIEKHTLGDVALDPELLDGLRKPSG